MTDDNINTQTVTDVNGAAAATDASPGSAPASAPSASPLESMTAKAARLMGGSAAPGGSSDGTPSATASPDDDLPQDAQGNEGTEAHPSSGSPGPARDASGRFAPKAEAPADGTASTDSNPGSTPAADAKQLDKAREALKRYSHFTDEDLKVLPRQRVLDMGKAVIEREAERERQAGEVARTKRLLEQIERERQAGQQGPTDPKDKANPPGDGSKPKTWNELIDTHLKPLREDAFNEDLLNGLEPLLREMGKQLDARDPRDPGDARDTGSGASGSPSEREVKLQDREDKLELRMAALPYFTKHRVLVDDPSVWAQVEKRALALAKGDAEGHLYFDFDDQGNAVPRYGDLVADAIKLTLGHANPNPTRQAQAQIARGARQAVESAPLADSGRRDGQKPALSPMERAARKAQLLAENKKPEEIERIMATA